MVGPIGHHIFVAPLLVAVQSYPLFYTHLQQNRRTGLRHLHMQWVRCLSVEMRRIKLDIA